MPIQRNLKDTSIKVSKTIFKEAASFKCYPRSKSTPATYEAGSLGNRGSSRKRANIEKKRADKASSIEASKQLKNRLGFLG